MHPLEVQVNDLKKQIEEKDKKLKEVTVLLTDISKQIGELKDMLHPSRQSYAEKLRTRIEAVRKLQ